MPVTSFHWGTSDQGGPAEIRREKRRKTLTLGMDPMTFLSAFSEVKSMPWDFEGLPPGYPLPEGLLDRMEFRDLLGRFRNIRSSVFDVKVTVTTGYISGGRETSFECDAATSLAGPWWRQAPEAARKAYYGQTARSRSIWFGLGPGRTTGSWATMEAEGERRFIGKKHFKRRTRPRVPRMQDRPPDILWAVVYAIWAAFDRCIQQSQGRGREYLMRVGLMMFNVKEIVVSQRLE